MRRDAVRLLIKDTQSSRPRLQDEEIKFFLDQTGNNLYRAASRACLALADAMAVSKSVGDLSISSGEQSDTFRVLATEYNALADRLVNPFAGGLSIGGKQRVEADTDRVVPAFTKTLFDNPRVGGMSST